MLSYNVAEQYLIRTSKEKNKIIADELKKNRYIEVWDKQKLIYSAEKWR